MVTSDSEYVAGTIQKRRAEARRRPGQDPRNGRRPARSSATRAREGAQRRHPKGQQDQDYDEDKPDQMHVVQLQLQRSFRAILKPSSRPCIPVLLPIRHLAGRKRGGFGGPTRPVADKGNRGSSAFDAAQAVQAPRDLARAAGDRLEMLEPAGRLWRRAIGENGESSANSPALWPCNERRPGSRRPLMGQSRGWTGGWTCESGSNGRPRRSAMN